MWWKLCTFEKNLLLFQMTSSWLIVVISVFTISYNFVKFFELTVIKVNFPRLSQTEVLFTSGDFVPTQREWKWQHQRDQWRVNTGKSPSRLLLEEKRRSVKGKVFFFKKIQMDEHTWQTLNNTIELIIFPSWNIARNWTGRRGTCWAPLGWGDIRSTPSTTLWWEGNSYSIKAN